MCLCLFYIVPCKYIKGNFQDREKMRVEKAVRMLYGRFFYRFPNGESAADVYDRITGTTISYCFFHSLFSNFEWKILCFWSSNKKHKQDSEKHWNQTLMLEGFSHQAKEIPTWTWSLSPMASLLESSSWDGTNGLLINMKDSTIWAMAKCLSWRKALVEGKRMMLLRCFCVFYSYGWLSFTLNHGSRLRLETGSL